MSKPSFNQRVQSTGVDEHSHFREVIQQICDGSEDAIWGFIQTYGPHMQRYVSAKLNDQQTMRTRFDSHDFVQMVWMSFFRDRETIATFTSPDSLLRFLVVLARNKFVSELRHSTGHKGADVRRTRSLDRLTSSNAEPPAEDASPSHVAATREQVSRLLDQETERDRRIVEARMSGKTFVEIAAELGIAERTARRAIWRLVKESRELETP